MVASPDPQSKALMSLQEQYPPTKFNLLLPTTAAADVIAWHRMSVSIVPVDPNPLKGDVYQVASRKGDDDEEDAGGYGGSEPLFCLARPATDRIGNAAGVGYDPNRSKALILTPDQVVYETVGGIRRPDGTWLAFKATKELDLRVIEAELREKAFKKVSWGFWGDQAQRLARYYEGRWETVKGRQRFFIAPAMVEKFVSDTIASQMIQWRKNKTMRGETGARLRVIRGLLGIRLQYTQAELALPFVVPRIDFTPDLNDPTVKRTLLANAAGGYALYGRGGGSEAVHIPEDAIREAPEDDVLDAEYRVTSEGPATPVEHRAAPAAPTEAANPPEPEDDGKLCQGCGVEVTDNVAKYSKQKFGKPLCWNCQKSGGPTS